MRDLWPDLRYACRSLARRPGFTAVAVLTLALGIGANTTIFSAVHAFLISPLPFEDPERLVLVRQVTREGHTLPVSLPSYLELRDRTTSFAGLSLYRVTSFNLAGEGEPPERVVGGMTDPGFFDLFGVDVQIGRLLPVSGELTAGGMSGGPAVAVLGEGLWRRRFAADPNVVGRSIKLSGERFTVVGVLDRDVELPWTEAADVWVPISRWGDELIRSDHSHVSHTLMIGRLGPGVSPHVAAQEATAIYDDRSAELPHLTRLASVRVESLHDYLTAVVAPAMLLLWGAVGFVLLIACANLASLMLVRSAERHRELVVRRALGAGRWRLIRHLLTESVALGSAGSLVGLLIGVWGIELLRNTVDGADRLVLDLPVLAFTAALGLGTGLLIGLLPAWRASRAAASVLASGGYGGTDRSSSGLRRALVGAEIAMALVLLIGAGLTIESVRRLLVTDPGFAVEDRTVADLLLPENGYGQEARRVELYDRLLARLEARPEIATAAVADPLPLTSRASSHVVEVEGQPRRDGDDLLFRASRVSPGYLDTLDIRLLAGRGLAFSDGPGAPPVLLVDELVARRLWPGRSAIGRRMRPTASADWYTVVGVVAATKFNDLAAPREGHLYYPLRQSAPFGGHLVVSAQSDPATVASVLREEVAALDPELPLGEVKSFSELRRSNVGSYWYSMLLLVTFAALALALAALGIYGVMAYAVTQRTREIGVRMALGAARHEVVAMVLGEGARLALAGTVVGWVAGVALSQSMTGLLYGVEPGHPVTVGVVTAVLAAVALLACWLPARRAAWVDPMQALRWE